MEDATETHTYQGKSALKAVAYEYFMSSNDNFDKHFRACARLINKLEDPTVSVSLARTIISEGNFTMELSNKSKQHYIDLNIYLPKTDPAHQDHDFYMSEVNEVVCPSPEKLAGMQQAVDYLQREVDDLLNEEELAQDRLAEAEGELDCISDSLSKVGEELRQAEARLELMQSL